MNQSATPRSPAELIAIKRDGGALSAGQIREFVSGFAKGSIPDYQMAAWAMAVFLQGMDPLETAALTRAMVNSGQVLRWDDDGRPVVDKHSTGGIGDKVSLVLAPLLACCDLRVPKISGRGLGPTGGTLDKLESIPGFRTDLSLQEIQDVTSRVGCVITGATAEIAPADKKLYALRDVTGTVPSVPLITASIMSKKLAEGLSSLVLDVKFGSGAFMKSVERARMLADSLVVTGMQMGVTTTALLTDMHQPLGRMVGNLNEVQEAMGGLSGQGPDDLMQVTIEMGAHLLVSVGKADSLESARELLQGHLESGAALQKFQEMVIAQGGDLDACGKLAAAVEVTANCSGYLNGVNAEVLGQIVILLGGGRRQMTDRIDHSVGLEVLVRYGDPIANGQPLVRVFGKSPDEGFLERLRRAFEIGPDVPEPLPLLVGVVPEEEGN